jgi:hypothetical protein
MISNKEENDILSNVFPRFNHLCLLLSMVISYVSCVKTDNKKGITKLTK